MIRGGSKQFEALGKNLNGYVYVRSSFGAQTQNVKGYWPSEPSTINL